ARKRGFDADMVPGISSLDCMSADLGIDPVMESTYISEATEFLLYGRTPDPTAGLVLFQVGVTANLRGGRAGTTKGLRALASHLAKSYHRDQEIVLYESGVWPNIPS